MVFGTMLPLTLQIIVFTGLWWINKLGHIFRIYSYLSGSIPFSTNMTQSRMKEKSKSIHSEREKKVAGKNTG